MPAVESAFMEIVGISAWHVEQYSLAQHLSQGHDSSVLIDGPSVTGKVHRSKTE